MVRLKNLKNIVERQLRDKPELRDSDSKLVARIWYNHLQSKSPIPVENMSAVDLVNEAMNWQQGDAKDDVAMPFPEEVA